MLRRQGARAPMALSACRLLTRRFGLRGQVDIAVRRVGRQFGQGLDRFAGWLDVKAVLLEQRPGLAFCLGDGAGHHAEQLGEHVLGYAEALADHGD
jgi:hypothetical protein